MEQTYINIKYPKLLDLNEFDIKMVLATRLYELGKLSSGQASDMVGLTKRTFIEMLGKYNVSVFGYTLDDDDLNVI